MGMPGTVQMVLCIVGLLVGLWGCTHTGGAAHPAGTDPQDRAEKVRKWLAWEQAQLPKHQVSLLDDHVMGEVESQTAPRSECVTAQDGIERCGFTSILGKDDDGDMHDIVCEASRGFEAFGAQVHGQLGEGKLEERRRSRPGRLPRASQCVS